MAGPIALQAPAKLNLALSVGPPAEPRGMHPICSWMVTVDLYDELRVTRLPDDRLSRYAILWHREAKRRSALDWPLTKDLAVRAHRELERRTGRSLPVQMKLEKRIPVGGGLGGGSSDAAAMLRAVDRLFDLGLGDGVLREAAATLGSDVPFLVTGGSAVVEGCGGELALHDAVREIHAVLAFPEASCPTGRVYGAYDELGPRPLRADRVRALAADPGGPRPQDLFNDLAEAAIRVVPALAGDMDRLGRLAERPACVCGSGSSLFVLCDDAMHAAALAQAVEAELNLPAVAARSVA